MKETIFIFVESLYRSGFLKRDQNHSPNSHQKIWRTNGWRTGALLGVISDIHRVGINPKNPMDIRNDSKQGTCLQAICSSNFLVWIWGMISIPFEKIWPVLFARPFGHVQTWIDRIKIDRFYFRYQIIQFEVDQIYLLSRHTPKCR